jgi:hypothetical protein
MLSVILDTVQRPTVRENRIMFGVRVRIPGPDGVLRGHGWRMGCLL